MTRPPAHPEQLDLSLEIVVLLVLGEFALLFGVLLPDIHAGTLSYNPDSTYGLFLVVVSFQVVTMGKTPFGDFRRSWALVLAGIGAAIVGMAACFIPGYFSEFSRVSVGMILLAGGFFLMVQLFVSDGRAIVWMRIGGSLRRLAAACVLIYVLTIACGVVTLFPGVFPDRQTAILLSVYGACFFYLSWCVWRAGKAYPPPSRTPDPAPAKAHFGLLRDASLPLSLAILVLLGVLLTVLGLLLFPVNFGALPFSPDGQLGVLLTVMAIQTMALGDTPLGHYRRTPLTTIVGLVFAALGIVSCIAPGHLTGMIQELLGVLNIVGGATWLVRRHFPGLQSGENPPATVAVASPIAKKAVATQTALNCVAIAFGISVLAPGLLPGLLVAGILVVNGLLLFRLASLLHHIAGPQPG